MKEKILDILEEICEDSIVRENLNVDLFEEDILDSLAFVQLLVEIEEKLGIEISPSEVEREKINTPAKIIAFLEARG